jgi:pyruvate-ferredoxin/flavodoxin oxidoreductase
MREGLKHQQAAVDCGHWPLYRYDPRRTANGLNPMQLDSRSPKIPFRVYAEMENRFRQLIQSDPEQAERLLELAQQAATQRYEDYARRASCHCSQSSATVKPTSEA